MEAADGNGKSIYSSFTRNEPIALRRVGQKVTMGQV
jgi:hypothetical protein